MVKYEIKHETPSNIDQLKAKANNKRSWRERLSAVEELKVYDCQQSRDILERIALHDIVFSVKEAAFRACQPFGIKKGGKPLYLGKKPKGNLIKGISKKLEIIARSLDNGYSLAEFKAKFLQLYPEEFDAYDGDKRDNFDVWLENMVKNLKGKSE